VTIDVENLARPRTRRRSTILTLGLLVVIGPLTVDLYVPAFPAIQDELPATASGVQLTLTAAMIGFAVGQLAVGPWSDAVGRRRPLLIAMTLHVAASIAVAVSPALEWVLVARVLQGIGSAGGAVVAMAIVRDLSDGRNLVRLLSRLALFSGLAPVVAPVVGSELMRFLDWRGLFFAVAVYGALILALAARLLPETLEPARRPGYSLRGHAASYRNLITDRRFVGIALIGGLLVTGVFTYVASSAFVFQERYELSVQQYGLLFAGNGLAFACGTQVAARLAQRFRPARVLAISLPVMSASGFCLAVAGHMDLGFTGAVSTIGLFMTAAGMSVPCLQVLGLVDQAQRAGTAAAVLGATSFGFAGLAALVVGRVGVTSVFPMGVVMGTALGIAAVTFWALVARVRDPAR
jgi:DHA1 family bicyclomycin/chloramphenicol resistance-like MFS transporter